AALSLPIGLFVALVFVPLALAVLRAVGHERENFEGRRLVNSGGLALLPSLLLALMIIAPRSSGAPIGAACGFALLGLIDDLWGSRSVGGLRGHFRALLRGRITTGALKALGGAAVALGVAAASDWPAPARPLGWAAHTLLRAALIALTANAVNLLDLRPLRALKGFALLGLVVFTWGLAGARSSPATARGALIGAAAAYAPFEARRTVMLGDAGANLLGAVLGLAAGGLPLAAQIGWLAAVAALHGYSERRSISAWIEAHAWAAAIDRWGWRDQAPAASESAPDSRNTR